MKRVYTVTFHTADNYGAVLQAYALQQILLKKYDTKILNYDCQPISSEYKLFKKSRGNFIKCGVQLLKDIVNIKKNYVRIKNFDKFRNNMLFTDKYSTKEQIINNYPRADVYITGSDQIWNPVLTDGLDDVFMLNFGHNDFKKIAYAASAGSNETLKKCEDELISNIKSIDYISAREENLSNLLTDKLGKNIPMVLDPSLLLSKNEWLSIVPSNKIFSEKYIFVYCGREPDYFYDIVNELAEETGYLVVYSGRRDREHYYHCRKKSYYEFGPAEFVSMIANAEYVVTASFHGTAFSIIFNKKLYAVLNKYSDRLRTLLDKLKLNDCIVENLDDFKRKRNRKIDWEVVNNILKNERDKSINWLYKSIDD